MKSEKISISDKINICFDLVDKAEVLAYDGFYVESNKIWTRAAILSTNLLAETDIYFFMEDEFKFLNHIANFLKDD